MVYTAAMKDYVTQNTAIRDLTNHVRESLTIVQQRAIAPGLNGTLGLPLPIMLERLGKIYGVLSSAALSALMATLHEAYVEGTDIREHTFRHQEVHRIYLATTTQALAEQLKISSFLGTLPPRFSIVEDNYVIAEPILAKRTFDAYAKSLHMWTDNHPMPTAASNGYAASSIAVSAGGSMAAAHNPGTTMDVLLQQMVLLAAAVTQSNNSAHIKKPVNKTQKGQKQCLTHKLRYHESKDCKSPNAAHRLTGIHSG